MLAAQGRAADALTWARDARLSADDELSYLREFEHVSLARVLLAQHRADGHPGSLTDAIRLLERLLAVAEEGGRTGTVLEVQVLLALAHHAARDTGRALDALGHALALAAPQGFVRVFVDEGAPVAELLETAVRRPGCSPYARRLLAHFGEGRPSPASPGLVDKLTERELAVLRMLGTELDGPEIARELVVSLNTVRTHTRNIYAKLGVNSRRAAVRRAADLGLLSHPR